MNQPHLYTGTFLLSEIEPASEEGILNLRNTLGKFGSKFVQVGRSNTGRMHLLFPANDDELDQISAVPKFHGLEVSRREMIYGDLPPQSLVDVSAELGFEISLFGAIVDEFVSQIEGEQLPLKLLITILEKWQTLLSISSTEDLQKSKIIGLYGELLVLEALLNGSSEFALDNWTGPMRHRHDFELPSCALEVKTSTRTDQLLATIHGHDQLENFNNERMFLSFVRLEWNPHGRGILDLINEIFQLTEDPELFSRLLAKQGIDLTNQDLRKYVFNLVDAHIFTIDENFPKITSKEISQIMNLEHFVKLEYTLNLSGLSKIDVSDMTILSDVIND